MVGGDTVQGETVGRDVVTGVAGTEGCVLVHSAGTELDVGTVVGTGEGRECGARTGGGLDPDAGGREPVATVAGIPETGTVASWNLASTSCAQSVGEGGGP